MKRIRSDAVDFRQRATVLGKSVVSADYRRWRRILDSLTLSLDDLPKPISGPHPPDFLICGPPRSGTALATAALFQPPAVITVMEPWDALRMPPDALVDSIREELLTTGTLGRGRLDVEQLDAGRVTWCRDGEKPARVEVNQNTAVGVKLPGFWRYLDYLPHTKFIVCLREPGEILASFAATTGSLREGLEYDVAFYRDLNEQLLAATTDPRQRRAMLLERILSGIAPHVERPEVFVIRYERWFIDPQALIAELAAFLGVALSPGTIRIRQPKSEGRARQGESGLVRDFVPSAKVLGY